jgi:uncharacterized membrane protein
MRNTLAGKYDIPWSELLVIFWKHSLKKVNVVLLVVLAKRAVEAIIRINGRAAVTKIETSQAQHGTEDCNDIAHKGSHRCNRNPPLEHA